MSTYQRRCARLTLCEMIFCAKSPARPPNISLTDSQRGSLHLLASMLEVYHVLWVSVPVLCLHNLEYAPNFVALIFRVQFTVEGDLTCCLIYRCDEIKHPFFKVVVNIPWISKSFKILIHHKIWELNPTGEDTSIRERHYQVHTNLPYLGKSLYLKQSGPGNRRDRPRVKQQTTR